MSLPYNSNFKSDNQKFKVMEKPNNQNSRVMKE